MSDTAGSRQRILGTLTSVNGKGVVTMEDQFDTAIEDVWSGLTQPERLARWIGEVSGDLRLGGSFRAHFFTSGWEGSGRIEVCEPPERLRVITKDDGMTDEVVIEATLKASGSLTSLVIEERGMPLEQLFGYGAGIQIEVENLSAYLSGREVTDAKARWIELEVPYRVLASDMLRRQGAFQGDKS